ncbi:hypothetical protein A1O1_04872 [Capronia coronata CBS 617.96]|uniref:Alcohol dehydrogenase n=1 Tax=Capronia coronata CBS 617.96 TaxID=1182541 RepID=W9YE70_9EURO|nr:uncharacterized protein A1O1_04872 [Capronia coronata CBS 617.96]EXJ87945.1 hypothetical protein A1O1_04872 [Capronia coronata CBS 617.96]
MFSSLRTFYSQSFNIPPPSLTEHNLPDQSGKVFLITGANTGIGAQLASILYQRNGTVYVAARTASKAHDTIDRIRQSHPSSTGRLEYLHLDLSDLASVKACVEDFLARETKLHWLNNNAAVMAPPEGSTGAQGLDLTYQTNILGPYLLTKLLLPVLRRTAAAASETTFTPAPVRVSWAGSIGIILNSPRGGISWKRKEDGDDTLDDSLGLMTVYSASKAANWFFAQEFGKRFGDRDRVLHNCYNPGNLQSELQRHSGTAMPRWFNWLLHRFLLFPAIYGAYTELYAGLSPDLTLKDDQGVYVVPWGRKSGVDGADGMRRDIQLEAAKEGGNAQKLMDWCERVTREFC